MKAALYTRVSTNDQIDGFSLSAQLTELNRYCDREGIEVYKSYIDEGISGTLEARPEFQAMISDAEKKLFDIILVHKYDRFARNVELSQKVKKQLKKSGVALISITEPLEDSPMGFFVGGLHELMAEYYSRNLGKESKKGHIERARQGFHNGSVPYGYKRDDKGSMVINEEQAKIVREIFHKYNYEGYGSTKIALWLNEIGIPTAVEGRWAHQPINHMLKNVKYIGKIYYDGVVYPGKHEPIISEEEFNLSQRFMKERTWTRELRGSNYGKFLLVGMLKCGNCHKSMIVHVTKVKRPNRRVPEFPYYRCSRAKHVDSVKKCENTIHHRVENVDKYFLNYIRTKYKHIPVESIERYSNVSTVLSDRKNEAIKELDRIKQALIKGYFSPDEYYQEKKKIEAEIKIIDSQPKNDKELQKEMASKIKNLLQEFDNAQTIAEKKGIIKKFVKCVYITTDSIDIRFVL